MKRVAFIIFTKFFLAFAMLGQTPCPTILVTGPKGLVQPNEPWVFNATLSKEAENYNIEYIWEVSGGKIVGGQGTSTLKVLMDEMCSMTATLEVKGLPKDCKKQVSASGEISECEIQSSQKTEGDSPIILDEFGKIKWQDEKARLQFASLEMKKKADFGLVFIISKTKKETAKSIANHSAKIKKYLTETQKLPKEKIRIIVMEGNNYYVRIYLIPVTVFETIQP